MMLSCPYCLYLDYVDPTPSVEMTDDGALTTNTASQTISEWV